MQPSQPAKSSSVTFLSHRRRSHGRRSVRAWRIKPLVQAAALTLLAASAHAQTRAFSGAWFAERGAAQNTAAATGRLPNGTPVALINDPQQQSQQARQQLQQSLANLNGVAAAIAAQQAAQNTARQAALSGPSDVPDGLADGGLKVDTNSLTRGWVNANAPVQSNKDGRVNVAIQQTADKAVLNWETYNVGRNTTVEYQQQSNWSVLNRVNDPNGRPSQIRGQIKADGTVLIVNRNGVIFTGSSQVDTRNLVAAAASITDDQFRKGLYGDNATPTFTNAGGKIKVEAGAQISTRAPQSVTQGGGYVLLVGTEVENAGTINTPKGQTQLAAGDNFIIRKGVGTDGNTTSTTRGNEIVPQTVANGTTGRVINSGLIVATQGDITLAGRDVAQNGVAISTTTVNTRGTIHLLNSANDTKGRVTVGPGATTAILIEQDAATALDSQRNALLQESVAQDKLRADTAQGVFDNLSRLSDRRDLSRIEIVSGGDVLFADNSLSLATGGQIQVSAARRALVTDRARLDVGGAVGVQVSMESNNVQVNVQGNEQRDAPGNRDSGVLNNANVWIDRRRLVYVPAKPGVYDKDRYYTAGGLLEVGGYLDNTGHSIGEWAAQGGTIMLGGKEVVTQRGSSINLSGGSLDVQTGFLRQTFFKGRDGQLYDASSAPMDVLYAGVYQGFEAAHPRWGNKTTEYFYSPLIAPRQKLENGYTAGRDAGQLILSTPTAVVDGDIVSAVYNGPRQTQARSPGATDGYTQAQTAVAIPAALRIGRYDGYGLAGAFDTQVRIGDVAAIEPISLKDALPADRINTIQLDAQRLNDMGLGGLSIASQGNVTIDKRLVLADGGTVSVAASSIDVNADVVAHGGNVTLSNVLRAANPTVQAVALTKDGKSRIALAQGATVDVSGLWINGALDPVTMAGMAWLNGGNVSMEGVQGIALASGSTIDVSSGAGILSNGSVRGGKGGNVTLTSNTPPYAPDAADGSTLQLGSTIKGYGVNGGGALTVAADKVLVSNGSGAQAGQLLLTPDFFRQGFSAYDVNGYRGLTVAPGTALNVEMPVYFVPDAARRASTGVRPADVLTLWTPPVYQEDAVNAKLIQRGGASLTLQSNRLLNLLVGSQLQVGQGTRIAVDPGQTVTLQTPGQITVDGAIAAPGGTIRVLQMNNADSGMAEYFDPTRSIWIGDRAVLDVAARAVTAVDQFGRRYGTAGNGGTIAIGPNGPRASGGIEPAANAFIIIRPGAVLDASGAGAVVDVPEGAGQALPAGLVTRPVALAGDGGTIALASYNGIHADGTMRAAAGGAGAAGGTLSVTLETPRYGTTPDSRPSPDMVVPRELLIGAVYRPALPVDFQPGKADSALSFGKTRLGVDRVAAGGFGALSAYADMVTFDGPVNLSLGRSLQIRSNALSSADASSAVHLSAPYVRFDQTAVNALGGALYPIVGGGTTDVTERLKLQNLSPLVTKAGLTVDANLIDLVFAYVAGAYGSFDQPIPQPSGQIARAGFDTMTLNSTGDIRVQSGGGGSRLFTLNAAQVYPVSSTRARLAATERITFGRNSAEIPNVPDSVFGALSVFAPSIEQGGVLRAPLGNLSLGTTNGIDLPTPTSQIRLLPGSLTSVSGAGLTLPYGGTSDGVSYTANGAPVSGAGSSGTFTSGVLRINGNAVDVAPGAVLDLSGGGVITGAGFVSGRGGSVDVLRTPFINANPAFTYSAKGNAVYAIVPGYRNAYAPFDVAADAASVGRQITIGAGVPGLAPGVYTLLPAAYALLPGAYRVELGATGTLMPTVSQVGAGTYLASGMLGTANTGVQAALPTQIMLTPGDVVRKYSQYNETGYADFVRADANRFGKLRSQLPADGGTLQLLYGAPADGAPALKFAGVARFDGAPGGYGGALMVDGTGFGTSPNIEVAPSGATPTAGFISLDANALNAIGAPRMSIGGGAQLSNTSQRLLDGKTASVTLRSGAELKAREVLLIAQAGGVVLEDGARISTLGQGADTPYPSTDGYTYSTSSNLVAVSNGLLNVIQARTGGTNKGISIGKSELYGEGSLLFSTQGSGRLALSSGARYGAKYLTLSMPSINIGEQAALDAAASVLPDGLRLNQDLLSRLLAGNTGIGVPKLENLVLTASQSVNFYGTAALNTIDPVTGRSSLASFVLNTPAIYGLGNAGDVATITTDKLVWNGISDGVPRSSVNQAPSSLKPGAVIAGGAGTGSGTLNIVARDMVFGYGPFSQPDTQLTLDRLTLGFANVNVQASGKITANNRNTLSVYQAQGAYQPGTGYQYSGGNLNLVTPMLTGESGAINRITAGGALSVSAPAGAGTVSTDALGAEIGLQGNTVSIASAIVLPSGKLTLSGDNGVTLAEAARIDVAGRAVQMADVTKYSAGGDVLIDSARGNVSQAAGAMIDVSAQNNHGGSVSVTALDAATGRVDLSGTIRGAATGRYDAGGTDVPWQAGSVDVRAQTLNDFAGLNQRLTAGGVTGSRSFQIKQGDLVIGDELKAGTINLSLDGGSLTVNGRVDASGEQPGTIRLAARNGLTLGAGSVLDAHGIRLRVDSYGQPIDATNRGIVELRATDGRLTLSPGAVIDVRSADNVARGTVTLSAPRIGADAQGDMAIDASGPLDIRGAKTIAVQGFRRYSNAPLDTAPSVDGKPNQVITQGWMNGVDADNRNFINAAWNNSGLQARMAGLRTYGAAYHLRPGVEIVSATPDGNLLVRGDLDFSGYRYGPNADPNVRGSGEPGALVIRAGGKLQVSGSINDGFAPPPATQDETGWVLTAGKQPYGNDVVVSRSGITLADGTLFAPGVVLNYDVPLRSFSLPANTVVPAALKLGGNVNVPAGTVLRAAVRNAAGSVVYPAGTVLRQDTMLTTGMTLDAGNVLAVPAMVASIVWPKGVAIAGPGTTGIALNGALNLAVGAVVPGSTTVKLPNNAQFIALRDTVNGSQGSNWAIAPMLRSGTESWAMRLVSGADTVAADGRAVRPDAQKDGNLVLGDAHFSAQMPTKTTLVQRFPLFSVLRTGTGDLDLVSGGNIDMRSTYGIYTAGTQSAPLLDSSGNNPYSQLRGTEQQSGSTVLGPNGAPYEPLVNGNPATSLYQAWYPEHGGNLMVSARGAISGHTLGKTGASDLRYFSNPGTWLWRQGGSGSGLPTAWWVNFGTYAYATPGVGNGGFSSPIVVGFTGVGTLGGGNVRVSAGGDVGMQSGLGLPIVPVSEALNIAVASTGRLGPDGKLVLTGGGDLSLNVGGGVNPLESRLRNPSAGQDDGGTLTNLRGNLRVDARSIGRIELAYGTPATNDPRGIDAFAPTTASSSGGLLVVPGDATVNLTTRGDLVLAGVGDAGRLAQLNATPYLPTLGGVLVPQLGGGYSWFSLWTDRAALNLFSAGGNLTPTTQSTPTQNSGGVGEATDGRFVYPGTLRAIAARGNIYYGGGLNANTSLVLAPSPVGQLEILASGSLFANGYAISQSGASQSALATPFTPGFRGYGVGSGTVLLVNNISPESSAQVLDGGTPLFTFGPDTASGTLHANDSEPARFYAVNGDIVGLRTGDVLDFTAGGTQPSPKSQPTWYVAAKPTWILAGRDIVGAGTAPGTSTATGFFNTTSTGNLLLNNNPNDISVVSAGRDILFGNFRVAGPGTLEVTAGRNLYQADKGLLESIGRIGTAISISPDDRGSGAGISVMAGAGAAGADFTTFARRYLDMANLANPNAPLADQTGKVAKTYEKELLSWLQTRFGYTGTQDGALAFYLGLPTEQQRVFARSVYFSELQAGGREYNDPTSRRFGSYLRGRQAIASLFPDKDAQGRPIQRDGTITMFGPSGIRTDFGGGIQTLTPGGKLIVGVEGQVPPATSGLLTQGSGDIQIYSKDSVLLGLSRIMTTFGGSVLVWSAEGDINAGRGSKTSLLYTPPRRVYDSTGNVTLSPQVPSSGAGIATLNPIPEVPRGNVDLIAPLGTVDPGEAGIRVSGDINVAALRVVNAANIQAQGESRGIPTVALVNVNALSSASAAANSATQAAQDVMRQQQAAARNGLPSIITVQVLGYGGAGGGEGGDGAQKAPPPERQGSSSYDPGSAFQMIGNGDLTERQKMRLTAAERKNL